MKRAEIHIAHLSADTFGKINVFRCHLCLLHTYWTCSELSLCVLNTGTYGQDYYLSGV